jgi:hypothetical protein
MGRTGIRFSGTVGRRSLEVEKTALKIYRPVI